MLDIGKTASSERQYILVKLEEYVRYRYGMVFWYPLNLAVRFMPSSALKLVGGGNMEVEMIASVIRHHYLQSTVQSEASWHLRSG